jgi:SAM-dependent methyltransferase
LDILRLFCGEEALSDMESALATSAPGCRACHRTLDDPVLDLGSQPVVDDPLPAAAAASVPLAPVVVRVCPACTLVQLDPPAVQDTSPTAAADMAAALARSLHGHARRRPGAMTDHLVAWSTDILRCTRLPAGSLVVDTASGDGALLDPFRDAGMTVLGHEPRSELADAARASGVPTITGVFGSSASATIIDASGGARLMLVNHALAHLDDMDAAVAAMGRSLAPDGSVAVEFLDVTSLVAGGLFDVFGHAHRCYLSLTALERLFARHGLAIVAARRSSIHGGSIQALARKAGRNPGRRVGVDRLLARDSAARLSDPRTFALLGERASARGRRLRRHLEVAAAAGTRVAGYGAPGRAVSLLAIAGVGPGLLPYTVDRDREKQGLALPGSAIAIRDVAAIDEDRPDEVMVLAWTWAAEIGTELARVRDWGGRLIVPLPRLRTLQAAGDMTP